MDYKVRKRMLSESEIEGGSNKAGKISPKAIASSGSSGLHRAVAILDENIQNHLAEDRRRNGKLKIIAKVLNIRV